MILVHDDDANKQLELFARVLSYVENNYVEPVDRTRVLEGAIKGMVAHKIQTVLGCEGKA